MIYLPMYKVVNFTIKTTLFFFVLLHLLLYVAYRYQLKDIDLSVYKAEKKAYKSDYYTILWMSSVTQSSSDKYRFNDMKMQAIYPIHVVRYFFMKHNASRPSHQISYWLVSSLSKLRHQHVKKYAIQIWLSHHLSFEEVATLYFANSYYGHDFFGLEEASKGYFNKNPNELNIYEIIMLVTLTTAPSSLDPKRHPKNLLVKMNSLITKLKRNFPLYYEGLTYLKKIDYKNSQLKLEKSYKLPKSGTLSQY